MLHNFDCSLLPKDALKDGSKSFRLDNVGIALDPERAINLFKARVQFLRCKHRDGTESSLDLRSMISK
jgi:hypothetical protein